MFFFSCSKTTHACLVVNVLVKASVNVQKFEMGISVRTVCVRMGVNVLEQPVNVNQDIQVGDMVCLLMGVNVGDMVCLLMGVNV